MPSKLRLSTWVREDLFAGYMDGDMARYAQGVKKLDAFVAKNPNAPDGAGWQAANALFEAARAHEAGDRAGFDKHYAKAQELFSRAATLAVQDTGGRAAVFAITGGSHTAVGDRLPEPYRRTAWTKVRESYTSLRELQMPAFDKFPPHFRGEVLSGLAQAAQRLGEAEKATKLTQELVEALPNTPYAVFGKRWLDKPETMAKSKITCVSCHDPGRLEPTLARLAKQ